MIVKVQVPLFSTDPHPSALIYDRHREYMRLVGLPALPPRVLAAAKITGKAYFAAVLDENDELIFNEQVPLPNW